MVSCRIFPADEVEPLIDFGRQPLTNRFLSEPNSSEETFPLHLGVSPKTGLIQQMAPAPHSAVRSRFSWIKYNEAEDHLDDVVDRLWQTSKAGPSSRVLALSYKDSTLLARLAQRGATVLRSLDVSRDLGLRDPNVGLETIQSAIEPNWGAEFRRHHGAFDLVLARHIFEHTHDPKTFLATIAMLVAPGGHLLIEAPDSTTFLASCDYTMPWEEHIFYFTPYTLRLALATSGFEIQDFTVYPYQLENSMVAVLRKPSAQPTPTTPDREMAAAEVNRARAYAKNFADTRANVRTYLANAHASSGRIALLGAGHAACMYANLLGIAPYLDFAVDDAPEKQGLFLPGSRLPIKPSAALTDECVKFCLLSVNHNTEDKVVAKNQRFIAAGGQFFSIFRTSKRRIPA